MVEIILLVGWVLLGMYNLCSNEPISKTSYFCAWLVVATNLILKIVQ